MRVLLIKPPTKEIYKTLEKVAPEYPPTGLAYIASYLEQQNHEVKILDLSVEQINLNKLKQFIDSFKPEIIGLTAVTPNILRAYNIINNLKKEFPNIYFVIGGPHATALPNESLLHADFVVRGEGEETFSKIVEAIEQKKKLSTIKGISFKNKNKIIHNPNRPLIKNIDTIPHPSWHLLDIKKYDYFGTRKKPVANIFTSRGCPYKCSFCNKNIFGYNIRLRSNKNILEEIDLLVNNFGVKEIHISDDMFNINRKKTIDLFKEVKIRKYDVAFFPQNGLRVDSINKELLDTLWNAGFYGLTFGVESGDQEILNKNNKGTKLTQIRKAFEMAKKYDFVTWGFFLLGLMGETKESIMKTINFAIELDPDIAKFSIIVPYPGTQTYETYKNRIKTANWNEYGLWRKPVFEPENMTSEELWKLYSLATKKFYLRPKKILNFAKDLIKHPILTKEYYNAAKGVLKIK
ncbi:MAG: radical SAM protein [Nanoarchaeota archaeon]